MIVRSLFGAVFPLFAAKMYAGLGVAWSSSLLGFVAIALGEQLPKVMTHVLMVSAAPM